MLLSRSQFREKVFERDAHKCVICAAPAVDAHHIMERRLWPDGGYYLDNGASVCEQCHLKCESTEISLDEIRKAAKVKPIFPPHLYPDNYDKWGNLILPDGRRMRGELADDESVQKILIKDLEWATSVKYPRTMHLPWSPGVTSDDRIIESLDGFKERRIVVTEKMDGENTTFYTDHMHARSMDSQHHPSQGWVKNFWGSTVAGQIPEGWRICGENLYAVHSIRYDDLHSYFYGFSIWNGNLCLSWTETVEWFDLLGIVPAPVLYDGLWSDWQPPVMSREKEGYVVRVHDSFHARDFGRVVAKYVRSNHVESHRHWRDWDGSINGLKDEK